MKTVFVFGATGTLGAYTALYLRALGYNTIAVGRRGSDNGFFAESQIPYYSVDITKKSDFAKLPESTDATVVHFAGVMPAAMQGYRPQDYIDSVVTGTHNVLKFCRTNAAERIVFSQTHSDSSHLQGSTKPIPSDIIRSFPPRGDHAVCAICKNAAVDLIEHFHTEFGLKRFILRLPTIYAYTPNPYFYVDGVKRMMAYRFLIERARKAEPVEIWGNPGQTKEIVYIMDFCQIVQGALTAAVPGGIYNVGRGIGVTLEEQIRGIVEVFSPSGHLSSIVYRPDKPDARQFIHDVSKTVNELGYVPQYDYLTGLRHFKAELEQNRFRQLWGDPPEISV